MPKNMLQTSEDIFTAYYFYHKTEEFHTVNNVGVQEKDKIIN